MSIIALTIIPDERNPSKTMDFAFTRTIHGDGGWVTRRGLPGLPPNCLVHSELQRSLTTIAKERGLTEQYNFMAQPPKPAKPVRVPRVKSDKKTTKVVGAGMVGGFNPFA